MSRFVDWYGLVVEGAEINGRVDWGEDEATVCGLVEEVRRELKLKLSQSLALGYGTEFTILTRVVDCMCELSVFHSDAAVDILRANGFTPDSVKDMILYNGNVRGFRKLFESAHDEFVEGLKTTIAVVNSGANIIVERYGFALVEYLLKSNGPARFLPEAAVDSGSFGEALGRLVAKLYSVEYSDGFKPCAASHNYAGSAPSDAEGVYMGFLFGLGVGVMHDRMVRRGIGEMLLWSEINLTGSI